MKLYDFERSGNCYKVRLLLALLKLDYERVPVDLSAGDNFKPEFLALNPRGQIPLLVDEDIRVWDSMAILVYLARHYGDESWLPLVPERMAEVMQWLAVSENEILYGLAKARAIQLFARPGSLEESQLVGQSVLKIIDAQLSRQPWLCRDHVTIADIACFPYVALAPEGGFSLAPYSNIASWIERIKTLSGYIGMPGID
ncbi:MAG: glutathione S-transferase [Gammaproteobacteria bacterium SG8_47]|nr:MAG: glutathione S-transferase [Gammaproteobacteria bacterium SG8_47]